VFFEQEQEKSDAEEQATNTFVIASDAPDDRCGLCHEALQKSWHEDSEEWVYLQCVMEGGKVNVVFEFVLNEIDCACGMPA
jgi:hypothetical protein